MALLLHASNGEVAFSGGLMLALALPAMWCLSLSNIRRAALQGSSGRVSAIGGLCASLLLWVSGPAVESRGGALH